MATGAGSTSIGYSYLTIHNSTSTSFCNSSKQLHVPSPQLDLSVELQIFIPTYNEQKNLRPLLPWIEQVLKENTIKAQIIVIDATCNEQTRDLCARHGAVFLSQDKKGFGSAMRMAWKTASAPWFLTMDADLSHPPDFIAALWRARNQADLIIASRYVEGGGAQSSWLRIFLSRCLNSLSRRILQTQVHDLTSNFRLYRTASIRGIETTRVRFDVLQEILVHILNRGKKVLEVPFFYEPRFGGASSVRLWTFGKDYLLAVFKDWQARNTSEAVDYDFRAYRSAIPLQRYWQRARYRRLKQLIPSTGTVLDIGCGTNQLIIDHPHWLGADIDLGRLRFLAAQRSRLCQATISSLPFKSASITCVVCSQVIQYLPHDNCLWNEIFRVLRPGGTLILTTVDHGSLLWPFFRTLHGMLVPGNYVHGYATSWTKQEIWEKLSQVGLTPKQHHYILASELIVKAIKP